MKLKTMMSIGMMMREIMGVSIIDRKIVILVIDSRFHHHPTDVVPHRTTQERTVRRMPPVQYCVHIHLSRLGINPKKRL